ncbi:hypothetical protein F5144DRAFT_482746 [Chaetomium tenue]|uniref:Uncharacterized protein n=1 Tax=Chaetomium tenue TaxID=1854479 RepID=A0ACB7PJA2_9PEZI|nr:hypothetical protein F5144DRAFT_482746 [Chaetomium globosum]
MNNIGHFAASLMAFIWPKVFFDFATKRMDVLVSPIPILQLINLFLATVILAWEWPLNVIAWSHSEQSIISRLLILPLTSMISLLIYQATDVALYYLVGFTIYLWAYRCGEKIPLEWW